MRKISENMPFKRGETEVFYLDATSKVMGQENFDLNDQHYERNKLDKSDRISARRSSS